MITFIQNNNIIYSIADKSIINIELTQEGSGYIITLQEKIPLEILQNIWSSPSTIINIEGKESFKIHTIYQGIQFISDLYMIKLICLPKNNPSQINQEGNPMTLFFGIKYQNKELMYVSDNTYNVQYNERETAYSHLCTFAVKSSSSITYEQLQNLLGNADDILERIDISVDNINNVVLTHSGAEINDIALNVSLGGGFEGNGDFSSSIDFGLKKELSLNEGES